MSVDNLNRGMTAQDLPAGSFFRGHIEGNSSGVCLMAVSENEHGKGVVSGLDFAPSSVEPSRWVVVESLGTFSNPIG